MSRTYKHNPSVKNPKPWKLDWWRGPGWEWWGREAMRDWTARQPGKFGRRILNGIRRRFGKRLISGALKGGE